MPYITISIVLLALIVGAVIYLGMSRMKQENKKPNKAMFWIGMAIVAIAVIFFLTTKEEMENKTWVISIWIMGIGLIAGSEYRILK